MVATLRIRLLAQLALALVSHNFASAAPAGRNVTKTLLTQTSTSTLQTFADTGVVSTSLDLSGHVTSLPFVTSTSTPHFQELGAQTVSLAGCTPVTPSSTAAPVMAVDPFQPVATGAIPCQIPGRSNHPVPRLNIQSQNSPLHTNKFYANFFLGDQTFGSFVHPYSLTWAKGGGPLSSWGMAVSHIMYQQKVFGPANQKLPGNPAQFMINPIGIQDVILSAAELGSQTTLHTSALDTFSANAILFPSNTTTTSSITFPLVQGMGFVTAIYNNLTPSIGSGHAVLSFTKGSVATAGVFKYTITLNDGNTWYIYATPSNQQDPKFALSSTGMIMAPSQFSGTIQIAKSPDAGPGEALYDASAGVYPTAATLTGAVQSTYGSYTITWSKAGKTSNSLLMWALPHHVASFPASSGNKVYQATTLTTTTKGNATAVVGDSWTMVEHDLPDSLGFAPWDPVSLQSTTTLSPGALQKISAAAISELSQDINAQTNLNSMYYSGKGLAKFASIVYVANDILKNSTLASQGLAKLEQAFALFASNQQQFPLAYDSSWGGVVSTAGYSANNLLADFGNTAYNDHHFHYGYFIYTAAVIGHLNPSWLSANSGWVNSLVRDVSNPSKLDNLFPVFRNFDWYHGHSWAQGLFASGDGKDEESSSEDTNFAYALKMWGSVIGDTSMQARGNLMLAVLARSLQSYFLYEQNNAIEPSPIVGNKVSGILFENKIDHTTYFGTNLEYIQGIHMLPILSHSALIRSQQFVKEEWTSFFADGAVDPASQVQGGWRGILYSNLALSDAKSSYAFFSQPNFDSSWLDGGASLTWYLAYAAGRGGG